MVLPEEASSLVAGGAEKAFYLSSRVAMVYVRRVRLMTFKRHMTITAFALTILLSEHTVTLLTGDAVRLLKLVVTLSLENISAVSLVVVRSFTRGRAKLCQAVSVANVSPTMETLAM